MHNSNEESEVTEIFLQDLLDSMSGFGDALVLAKLKGPGAIRLNFSGVSLLSSAFLGKLVVLRHQISNSGRQLTLCHIAPSVHDQFKITGFDRLFRIEDSDEGEEDCIPSPRQPKKPTGKAGVSLPVTAGARLVHEDEVPRR